MKKYLIQILAILVVATLEACDFDITNPGGGSHGGGGRDTMDVDTNYREPMIVDIYEGEKVETRNMKTVKLSSVTVVSDRDFKVELSVMDKKIGKETVVILSMENPSKEVNDCIITLLYIGPEAEAEKGEEVNYVVGLQIM